MLVVGLFAIGAMAQVASPPFVQTPGPNSQRIEIITRQIIEENIQKSQGSNTESFKEDAPVALSLSEIESQDKVLTRFNENLNEAKKQSFESYVYLKDHSFLPNDCKIAGTHPSGVQRLTDKKLNGISLLALCNDTTIDIRIMDYSFPLEQDIKTSLSKNYYKINNGYMNTIIGKADDNRIRRQLTAVGDHASVTILIQSGKNSKDNLFSFAATMADSVLTKVVLK